MRLTRLLALCCALALPPTWAPTAAQATGFEADDQHDIAVDPRDIVPMILGSVPQPLSSADATLYRRIFQLQEAGRWPLADQLIGRLQNRLLVGHVVAQRLLHPTAYVSSYPELQEWLERYADHPQAGVIHSLAMRRLPAGAPPPPPPVTGFLSGAGQELREEASTDYPGPADRPAAQGKVVADWLAAIRRLVGKGEPAEAAALLRHRDARFADAVEQDLGRWYVARGYLVLRQDRQAMALATAAAARSGDVEPRIHWTAGLAAWRLGEKQVAVRHFAALARSTAGVEDVAAGAFWAARAAQQSGDQGSRRAFLEIAADATDGFYGILAQHALGRTVTFDWHQTHQAADHKGSLWRIDGARRAMALSQVGLDTAAEAEIRKLAARSSPEVTEALAGLAESLRLPAAQMRVAQRVRLQDGRRFDGALYPIPPWEPQTGFTVDPAVLFAIMRAESGFDPKAESHAGALGLMQILPSTAEAMAKYHDIVFAGADSLRDPAVNLTVGQAYVEWLKDSGFGDSMIHLAMAYNAGPTRAEAWVERFADIDDPLLLMESIPIPETRAFARKVLSNLWAYRLRLTEHAPSLEALAAGEWPIYHALETTASGTRHVRAD